MKQVQYNEGPEAFERFERGMKALFQVPKPGSKKKRAKPATSRKSKDSDKN